jgi:hypothetical protein
MTYAEPNFAVRKSSVREAQTSASAIGAGSFSFRVRRNRSAPSANRTPNRSRAVLIRTASRAEASLLSAVCASFTAARYHAKVSVDTVATSARNAPRAAPVKPAWLTLRLPSHFPFAFSLNWIMS